MGQYFLKCFLLLSMIFLCAHCEQSPEPTPIVPDDNVGGNIEEQPVRRRSITSSSGSSSSSGSPPPSAPFYSLCDRSEAIQKAVICTLIESGIISNPTTCRDVNSRILPSYCSGVTRDHVEDITGLRVDDELNGILPDDFTNFVNLSELFINDLDMDNLNTNVFSDLSRLVFLSLSGNNLKTITADVFSSLSNLEILDLSDNDFDNLPQGVFASLSHLRVLYLDSNNLGGSSLNDFYSGLSQLEELDLSENQLTLTNEQNISTALPNCTIFFD